MEKIKKAIEWIKRHVGWIFLVLAGAVTGAALYRRASSKVSTLEDALSAEKRYREIDRLRVEEASLRATDREKANEILEVNARIAEHKQKLVELHTGKAWKDMPDDEVKNILKELGL